MNKYDILSIGIQVIDIVVSSVDKDFFSREITTVDSVQMKLGGDALNQAMASAALGAKTALMGLAGNDRMGDVLISQLKETAIDVYNNQRDCATAVSVVLVDKKSDRRFLYVPGNNNLLSFDDLDISVLKSSKIVSIGGTMGLPSLDGEGIIKILSTVKDAGNITAMDFRVTGDDYDMEWVKKAISLTDYLLPSELEASFITGEKDDPVRMAEIFRSMGANNVIIKLGESGCYVSTDKISSFVNTYPCNCIDTTGAGDTFVGSFLYGVSKDWDILEAARFANAAGSIAVEHTGANGFITGEAQVRERMKG